MQELTVVIIYKKMGYINVENFSNINVDIFSIVIILPEVKYVLFT